MGKNNVFRIIHNEEKALIQNRSDEIKIKSGSLYSTKPGSLYSPSQSMIRPRHSYSFRPRPYPRSPYWLGWGWGIPIWTMHNQAIYRRGEELRHVTYTEGYTRESHWRVLGRVLSALAIVFIFFLPISPIFEMIAFSAIGTTDLMIFLILEAVLIGLAVICFNASRRSEDKRLDEKAITPQEAEQIQAQNK